MAKLKYSGSVKDLFGLDNQPGSIAFNYTDAFSIFDWGRMPDEIPLKGSSLSFMAAAVFERLGSAAEWNAFLNSQRASRLSQQLKCSLETALFERLRMGGVRTHYRGLARSLEAAERGEIFCVSVQNSRVGPVNKKARRSDLHDFPVLVVDAVRVTPPVAGSVFKKTVYDYQGSIRSDSAPDLGLNSDLIPLEVVFRWNCPKGSSLPSRLKNNPNYLEERGFGNLESELGLSEFSAPIIELFTKLEPIDRALNYAEALSISKLAASELEELLILTQWVSAFLKEDFDRRGIQLNDGKFEWAINQNRELILVDAIGPDELRLSCAEIDLSKEVLRQVYRSTAWYQELETFKSSHGISLLAAGWQKKIKTAPQKLSRSYCNWISQMYTTLAEVLSSEAALDPGEVEEKFALWLQSRPEPFDENLGRATSPVKSSGRVLILGSGAREHALAWGLSRSPRVTQIFEAPGNPGMKADDQKPVEFWDCDLSLGEGEFKRLALIAVEAQIELVVIGPDNALADGVVDVFERYGLLCFGPNKAASRIESSKAFAKSVMKTANVRTAGYEVVTEMSAALQACARFCAKGDGVVVKADGLSFGKGVKVCDSLDDARDYLAGLFLSKSGVDHSLSLLIEERLIGEEVSCLAICDGNDFRLLDFARDHKTLREKGQGPNTGGMGVYSPVPDFSNDAFRKRVSGEIFSPILKAMKERGDAFKGILYAGLMVDRVSDQIWVLEFNARFGDPETQVLMPRLSESEDLFSWLKSAALGTLWQQNAEIVFSPLAAVYVVGASQGYPVQPEAGKPLEGSLTKPATVKSDAFPEIFFGAVKKQGAQFFTSGGRVFGVLGLGESVATARSAAYQKFENAHFKGMQIRQDIGESELYARKKIAILASGRGSNAMAIIRAIRKGELRAELTAVISDNREASVLEKVREQGLKAIALTATNSKAREAELVRLLQQFQADWVVLAGYRKILSSQVIEQFRDSRGYSRIVNIHPSLLPAFPGLGSYQKAFDSGVKVTGVTVHLVEPEVDAGPVVAQESFQITDGDTVLTVEKKGLAIEHRLYALTLNEILKEEFLIQKGRVVSVRSN